MIYCGHCGTIMNADEAGEFEGKTVCESCLGYLESVK
jgi:formylmethanofuran dehydrogenase subunit E